MVLGGSQQETLNPGFVLCDTRQQGVLVFLRELVKLDDTGPNPSGSTTSLKITAIGDDLEDEHGGSDADVKARIGKAIAVYLQLKNILSSKQLSTNTKPSRGGGGVYEIERTKIEGPVL
ncbi:unnamed protein product [Schistosoma margrebowiei]|uniref:Uncharacterized protein n=1 Tax=Schistosoma margrebowiei TaxID=48269 RepID=A0A183LDD5_9TREM|nr:unnamed protein product [Schistosoma margrebowiei]